MGACRGLSVSPAYWVGSGLSLSRPLLLLVLLAVPAGVGGCLLTPAERDQLLQLLPPSDPRVFAYRAGGIEVAEVEKILGRATAPIGRG